MKKIVLFFLATLIWLICAAVGFFLYILINKIFGETAILIAPGLFLLLCFFSVIWENKHVGHSRIRISYCGTMILLAFLLFLAGYALIILGIEYYEEVGMFAAMSAYGFGAFGLIHFLNCVQRNY